MKEFFHKHRVAILITGGVVLLYLFYKWYSNQQANATANTAAQDQAAAQNSYLQGLLYGTPSESLGGSAGSPVGSVSATGQPTSTTPTTSPTPATPVTQTTGTGDQGITGNGGIPAGTILPSQNAQPNVPAAQNVPNNPYKTAGAAYAFTPGANEAQDFSAEGYTGNFEQDAAIARQAAGVGTDTSTGLYLGSPAFLAAGGTGAPPELVAACNADQAAGRICGQPGTASDELAFQMGLPTQGNYESGPNNSIIQLSPGVTPVGMTPEEIATQGGQLYTAQNGVTFLNGIPLTGSQLPKSNVPTTPVSSNVPAAAGGGSSPTPLLPSPINSQTPTQPDTTANVPAAAGGGSSPSVLLPSTPSSTLNPVSRYPGAFLNPAVGTFRRPTPGITLPVVTPVDTSYNA